MLTKDHVESRSVPRLLALLAASVERETAAQLSASKATPWAEAGSYHARDPPCNQHPAGWSIRGLRRVYNIIIFGGPSHDEIIEQAALEDNRSDDRLSSKDNNNNNDDDDDDDSSALASIFAAVSAVSLELRRERRYDPANAIEGLIDDLIARHPGGGGGESIARILRLFTALRGQGKHTRNTDDWEVVGGLGRRALQRLYCSSDGNLARKAGSHGDDDDRASSQHRSTPLTQQELPQHQRNLRATTASIPVAMFFRDGRGSDAPRHPDHIETVPPPIVPDATKGGSDPLTAAPTPSTATSAVSYEYLLPNDCVLYGDSTIATSCYSSTAARSGEAAARFTTERIPWFADSDFTSERGIPDMTKRSSLDGYMEAVATAPPSPKAWTTFHGDAGGHKVASFSPALGGSSGAPTDPTVTRDRSGSEFKLAESAPAVGRVAVHGPRVSHALDLFGALSRARVDARSPAARELRVALSFPDLLCDRPTDLLEAAQFEMSGPAGSTGVWCNGGERSDDSMTRRSVYDHPSTVAATTALPRAVQQGLPLPRVNRRPAKLPVAPIASTWGDRGTRAEGSGIATNGMAALGLYPVGWERTEADWNDPAVPKWALSCAPLVTGEGGAGCNTFELCYREHFAGGAVAGMEEGVPVVTETEIIRRALAALQGVPSESFGYDEKQARMRVSGCDDEERTLGVGGETLPPRVAGLSPRAQSSLLEEFARAGTWYRRVEQFAACLVSRSAAAGQVSQAFGIELRRQLAVLQFAILGLTAEMSWLRLSEAEGAASDGGGGDGGDDRGGITCVRNPPSAERYSLTGVLVRTTEIRRGTGALAEICGLSAKKLSAPGGVEGVCRAFPRGGSLLTYLYNTAEVRAASTPGGVGESAGMETVTGDRESALALLSSAAAPYLAMLSRWLWSGEIWAEDDPCEEFPLRCRETLTGGTGGSAGNGWKGRDPWVEDGGGSFMTVAFCENKAASVPCFLGSGVLAAAARAGKLLRMLKLSSPEFYTACAASPSPPLSLVFGSRALASRVAVFARLSLLRAAAGRSAARDVRARAAEEKMKESGDGGAGSERLLAEEKTALGKLELQRERDRASVEEARRIWVQGLEGDRAAAAGAAAANAAVSAVKESSSTTVSGRGGILSFLDPPTSEAEEFAAAALSEKYRVLGEEADARAARARWKRQRSERTVAARASLHMLYAKEANLWKALSAEVAAAAEKSGTARNEVIDDAAGVMLGDDLGAPVAVGRGSYDGGETARRGTDGAVAENKGASDGDEAGWVEVKLEGAQGAIVQDGPMVSESTEAPTAVATQLQAAQTTNEAEALGALDVAVVHETQPNEEASSRGGLVEDAEAAALEDIDHETRSSRDRDEVKFSPVTIVDEPGGKSTSVTAALRGWAGESRGVGVAPPLDPPVKFSHVTIVQEPGGRSDGVSAALGGDADGGRGTADEPMHPPGMPGVPESTGDSGDGSQVTSSSCIDDDNRDDASKRLEPGDAVVEHTNDCDDHGSHRTTRHGLDEGLADVLPAAEATAAGRGGGVGRRDGEPLQGSLPSGDSSDATVVAAGEARAEDSEGGGVDRLTIPVGDAISVASANTEMKEVQAGLAGQQVDKVSAQSRVDVAAAATRDQGAAGKDHNSRFLPKAKERTGVREAAERDSPLPLEVVLGRCVREPVLAQCKAVDSAALAFLVRDAGVAEHLASFRTFLLGLSSDFLHDFTLRLLNGLYDSGVDWRRSSNLDAAFAASASVAGLDALPLAKTFRYEVDPTCGGVLGASFSRDEDGGSSGFVHSSVGPSQEPSEELYSPVALSFVSPVLDVPWPVGVLLPTGVLHTYGGIHRSLFRHQLVLHRLRRLRVALRELDASMGAVSGSRRTTRRAGGGGDGAQVSWDRGRLHWMHLFRHEMQHMADSLQAYFAERAEVGWPDLRRSLSMAEGTGSSRETVMAGGGLALLAAAHSRYISNMHLHMFLGTDRQGAIARGRIEEFYGVVCVVGRITDGLLLALSPPAVGRDIGGQAPPVRSREGGDAMLLPDDAFAELAAARERFDAARRGICGALSEISAAGGGTYARPFLAILGYGGYGGDGVV